MNGRLRVAGSVFFLAAIVWFSSSPDDEAITSSRTSAPDNMAIASAKTVPPDTTEARF